MKILLSDEQKLLLTMFSKIVVDEGEYFFIPYWFKKLETDNCFEQLSFEKLPENIQEQLRNIKNEKFFIKK